MAKLDRFRQESARRLRAAMTDEERILWSQIWRIPVEGTHFRRRASSGIYDPDFLSHRLKLIIEVDGVQHSDDANCRHDEVRTRWFATQGYRVIRFWNHEIKAELDSVLDTIYAVVAEQTARTDFMGGASNPSPEIEMEDHPTPALRRRPSPSRGG